MRRHIQLANLSKTGSPLLSLAIQSPGKQHQMQLSYEDPTIKFSKDVLAQPKSDCFLNCTFGATKRIRPESHMFPAVSGVSGIQKSPMSSFFPSILAEHSKQPKAPGARIAVSWFSEPNIHSKKMHFSLSGQKNKSTNRTKKSRSNVST